MDNQVAATTAYHETDVSDEGEELELSPLLQILSNHKRSAYNWQERRHDEWTENYMLYRDKVIVNRLTQRQSVNIPLMKTSIGQVPCKIDKDSG